MMADRKTWKRDLISEIFWAKEGAVTLSLPISKRRGDDHELILSFLENGAYSVKSAYEALMHLKHEKIEEGSNISDHWYVMEL